MWSNERFSSMRTTMWLIAESWLAISVFRLFFTITSRYERRVTREWTHRSSRARILLDKMMGAGILHANAGRLQRSAPGS